MERGRNLARSLALILFGAVLATTVMAVAAKKPKPKPVVEPAARTAEPETIRATGVGLPEVGAPGTTGAADYVPALKNYYGGGQYNADLAIVANKAKDFLDSQATAVREQAARDCNQKPKRKKKKKGKKRGGKKGKTSATCPDPRMAMVIDIDETAISNYEDLVATDFSAPSTALLLAVGNADSPAIAPVHDTYLRARQLGVSVFAITGRPASATTRTYENLTLAGYTDLAGVSFKPSGTSTIPYKSGERAKIEQNGYRIIVNIGDQESDLTGGYADRSFKLPNPFYFID